MKLELAASLSGVVGPDASVSGSQTRTHVFQTPSQERPLALVFITCRLRGTPSDDLSKGSKSVCCHVRVSDNVYYSAFEFCEFCVRKYPSDASSSPDWPVVPSCLIIVLV